MAASRVHRGWQLLWSFGPRWLIYRAAHAARMNSGLIRLQRPVSTWQQQRLSGFVADSQLHPIDRYASYRRSTAPRLFFDERHRSQYQPFFESWDANGSSALHLADDVRDGYVQFFSHERVDVGSPPLWHVDPFCGYEFPPDLHWSRIRDFAAADIKLVWETNRFGFVFPLVRAHWRTGNEQYAEQFWQLVESWRDANPPDAGANWKCGQEVSLRVMAWCFGLYGFLHSPSTTAERIAALGQMIAVCGSRIESNIGYALSQQNNHGVSEAMGLFTVGSLFPEFKQSKRWANLGRRLLESQAKQLIYDDGAFSQHSMNYHRVMLHDYLWSIRLAEVLGDRFSNELYQRIAKAGEFVYQLQDESTGRVPCYGQNDGALILPLTNCDYRDFRPIVQSIHFLVTGQPRLQAGPWDEESLWMFGPQVLGKANQQPATCDSPHDFDAAQGGYSTVRAVNGFAMIRSARFSHRPAQADMLHLDVWWRGQNVAIDPGTYSYNAAVPWNNGLSHTACHNTVTVDGKDQMEQVGRFLWLPWLKGKSFGRRVRCQGDVSAWNGQHDGYQRLSDPLTHRRGLVRIGADHWLVIDSLGGNREHSFRLHWLLCDAPFESSDRHKSINLQTSRGTYSVAFACSAPAQFDVVRAAAKSTRGWCSPYYHMREPAISVSLEGAATQILFATVFGPNAQALELDGEIVKVRGNDWNVTACLDLTFNRDKPLITSIDTSGSLTDPFSPIHAHPEPSSKEAVQCTFC